MCFCFVLGYVCELFSELVGFLFGCYCSVVFEGYCVIHLMSSVTSLFTIRCFHQPRNFFVALFSH